MKILFLSRWFPYPADNGSKLRILNLIRQLSIHHSVDLISFRLEPVSPAQIAALQPYCGKVSTACYHSFEPDRWESARGYLSPWPRSLIATHSEELARLAEEAAAGTAYDVVIASQIDMAPYALGLPVAAKIFEEVELTTLYEQVSGSKSMLKRLRNQLTWFKLTRCLNHILPQFHGVTVVSELERNRVSAVAPGYEPIVVIPNGVDLEHLTGAFGQPEPDTLIYNGALTYSANFDAVAYFLAEIFPLIRQQRPGVTLYVTGATEGVNLLDLPACDGVVFTGYLADIRPRVSQSWISVVPLRVGGGTRLKILESMALGTPVVSTCKGAEGLEVHSGVDILIADGPAAFAEAVLLLLADAGLREKLSAAGRKTVSETYRWDTIGSRFNGFLDEVVGGKAHGGF